MTEEVKEENEPIQLTNKERIEVLEQRITIFYKWLHHWMKNEQLNIQKHNSIKAQNFEQACFYRDEENKNISEWEAANQELLKHTI